MSLKPVELQVALPRTMDAGNLQHQLAHKPVQDQELLAAHQMKKADEMRKKAGKVDETGQVINEKDDDEDSESTADQLVHPKGKTKQNQKDKDNEQLQHPYKGHHIDLSL